MKIILEDGFKSALKSEGKSTVTIDLLGCSEWGAGEVTPIVKLEEPSNKDDYDLYEVDGFKVYVFVAVRAMDDTLTLRFKKILFKKLYLVEGVIK